MSKESVAKSQPPKDGSKLSKFVVRTVWTLVLISGFVAMILSGHFAIILVCMMIQTLAFREVTNITGDPKYFDNVPWGRRMNWYFLVVAMYYLNGEGIVHFFRNVGILETVLEPLINYHRFLTYCIYVTGFVLFVCTLQEGYYRQQFGQFSATHMAILLVVFQGQFVINNMMQGIFWMIVPVSLVIVNDIVAYLCGITFGRTPLIKISPKKTVEGFVGAWIGTVVFSFFVTYYASQSYYLICPMQRIGVNFRSADVCEPNPVFLSTTWDVPRLLRQFVAFETFELAPIYIHTMIMATFASLIAPFGGLFASGFKRAFKVKDFGDTIPGHGGITDRFDCQFVMGSFAWVYYQTLVAQPTATSVPAIVSAAASLSREDQVALLDILGKSLRPRV